MIPKTPEQARKLSLAELKDYTKQRINYLVSQGKHYSLVEPDYVALKQVLAEKYLLTNDSRIAQHNARTFIKRNYDRVIKPKKIGRPIKLNNSEVNNIVLGQTNITNYAKAKKIDRSTCYRSKKRQIQSDTLPNNKRRKISHNTQHNEQSNTNNILQETTEYKLPNVDIDYTKYTQHTFTKNISFGWSNKSLKQVLKQRKDCYGCNEDISKKQGKTCMMIPCLHPNNPKNDRLQWHSQCLNPLNNSTVLLCNCCTLLLSKISYKFKDFNNEFINDLSGIYTANMISYFVINKIKYALFIGYKSGDNTEYYFIKTQQDIILHQNSSAFNKIIFFTFNEWMKKYKHPYKRDEYIRYSIPCSHYQNFKYPNLEFKFLQNKATKAIESWFAIDGFEPDKSLRNKILNFIAPKLLDKNCKLIDADKVISNNNKYPGAYFVNNMLGLYFINYSYKHIKHDWFKQKCPKNLYHQYELDPYKLFKINNTWNNSVNKPLHGKIVSFTKELNKFIKWASNTYHQLRQFKNIQFKPDDMAAFLVYDRNQDKHVDTPHLMTLDDKNLANSSLYMINVVVNAKSINYNPKTKQYTAEYDPLTPYKIMCFDDDKLGCNNGWKNKHLLIQPGTIVIGLPPGVAMSAHHVHSISTHKWTIVFTNRGLSKSKLTESDHMSKLIKEFTSKLNM